MAESQTTAGRHDALARVARQRVRVGFAVGVVALALARPTWNTLALGTLVASVGALIRIWAAGHLEKGREITVSGPYRWVGHPLYLGSAIIGVGFAIVSANPVVVILVAAYLGVTLVAAIRTEEAALRNRFGAQYDRYRRGHGMTSTRQFSVSRALRNREHRAALGLLIVIGTLAVRLWLR